MNTPNPDALDWDSEIGPRTPTGREPTNQMPEPWTPPSEQPKRTTAETTGLTVAPSEAGTEGEIGLLGALLLDTDKAWEAVEAKRIVAEDFGDHGRRLVFEAIQALKAKGRPVDGLTVAEYLKKRGNLDKAGGPMVTDRLIDACHTSAHADYYASLVAEAGQKRRIKAAMKTLSQEAENDKAPAELLAKMLDTMTAEESRTATSTRFPSILNAATFTSNPHPEPPQIVHGVMHQGSKAVYGGPSKAFKSWVLLDLCLAVSTGGDWLGFHTTPGLVLYMNFELQPFAVHRRLKAIAEDRGCDIPDTLRIWNLRGHARPLKLLLPELKRQIKGEGYALIVPDPIYKTLSGRNENDAGDIGELCGELEAVAVETGAGVAFGAHFAKGNAAGKEAIDRVAGSGVWARDPDAIITATAHEHEGAFAMQMTLRNFPPQAPFVVRWKYPRMMRDTNLDPAALRQPRRPSVTVARTNLNELGEVALRLVKDKPLPVGVFDSRFEHASRLGEKAAAKQKRELIYSGKLAQTARREPVSGGGKYIGTEEAIRALEAKWESPELKDVTK